MNMGALSALRMNCDWNLLILLTVGVSTFAHAVQAYSMAGRNILVKMLILFSTCNLKDRVSSSVQPTYFTFLDQLILFP